MAGKIRRALSNLGRAPSGKLGETIEDISMFGGKWENLVATLHSDAHEAERARTFIATGVLPDPANPNPGYVGRQPLPAHSGTEHPRVVAALLIALDTKEERHRAVNIYVSPHHAGPATLSSVAYLTSSSSGNELLTVRDLEVLGRTFAWAPSALLDGLLDGNAYAGLRSHHVRSIAGLEDFVVDNIEPVRNALTPAKHGQDVIWNRLGSLGDETFAMLAEQLCDAATCNSKTLRKSVVRRYQKLSAAQAIGGLQKVIAAAKPAQRARVIECAAELPAGEAKDSFLEDLRERFASDRSAAVKEAIAALDSINDDADVTTPTIRSIEVPTINPSKLPQLKEQNRQSALLTLNGDSTYGWRAPWELAELLRNDHPVLKEMTPHHVARMWGGPAGRITGPTVAQSLRLLRTSELRPTPLVISETLHHDEKTEGQIIAVCAAVMAGDANFWTDQEISEWSSYHIGELINVLNGREPDYAFDRHGFLALLGAISPIPSKLQAALVASAISGYKSDQDALYKIVMPFALDLALPYLTSRKKAERIGAARLLTAVASPEAKEPLLAAARKEKDDMAMVAILSALDAIGAPLVEFTSTEALLSQATKALAKKNAIPKSIEWLNLESLPSIAWADGGQVDPSILQWFIISSVKGKTAEPSPLIASHFKQMDQQQVKKFGSTLLELWLNEDTRTYTAEEADIEATAQATSRHGWYSSNPGSPYHGKTVAEIARELTVDIRTSMKGSATTSKGLLAVVAAAAGPEVTDRCSAYIRKHRGHRVSQAKVLLQMLAWIDEPATVQLVMSIAARFRPKGIQVEAAKQAELLAERRGWTIDDLADRSVPDGGFEANGRRVLDYGDRTFTAHLEDDLTITLHNDETAKTVRSLPKGRADEDAEVIAEIKKDFSASKKELKSVLSLQPVRLHLAMCAQRSWSVDDFMRYMVQHPVMARLASRVVWASTKGGAPAVGFRPLTDGTLLLADDEEFVPPADATISVAHDQIIADDAGWKQHLVDYEVTPLFPQFDRPVVEVSDESQKIDDFVGHMFNDGTFRGQVNRHGWQLGTPQDGGWVHDIIKDVPTVDLTAVLSLHGGLSVAAYDVGSTTLAMGELFFVPSRSDGWNMDQSAVALSEVPPILLSEFYGEMQAMAAASDGHEPDYKKKVG